MKCNKKKLKSYLTLGLLISIFVGPLILAIILYIKSPTWLTYNTLNRGTLIYPPLDFKALKKQVFFQEKQHRPWKIFYLSDQVCRQICRQRLHSLHQVTVALGKYSSQVAIALIQVGSSVMQIKNNYPINNYSITAHEYQRFFVNKKMTAGYYLIDPTEKIILYYSDNTLKKNLYKDLTHLLSISSNV